MQPLNDYVVVKLIDLKKDTLIVLSTDAENSQPIGEVFAVGPGRFLDQLVKQTVEKDGFEIDNGLVPARAPMTVKKGDIVVFYKGASQKIEIDNEEYYVMSETNIFLILNSNVKDINNG